VALGRLAGGWTARRRGGRETRSKWNRIRISGPDSTEDYAWPDVKRWISN
jgi:hypothetical protein